MISVLAKRVVAAVTGILVILTLLYVWPGILRYEYVVAQQIIRLDKLTHRTTVLGLDQNGQLKWERVLRIAKPETPEGE